MSVVIEVQRKVAETVQRCGACGRFFGRFCWGLGLGHPVVLLHPPDPGRKPRAEYIEKRLEWLGPDGVGVEWSTGWYVALTKNFPEEKWREARVGGHPIQPDRLEKFFPPRPKRKAGRPPVADNLTHEWVTHTLNHFVEPWLRHLGELGRPVHEHVGEVFAGMPDWLAEAIPDLDAFGESPRKDYVRRPTAVRLLGLIPQRREPVADFDEDNEPIPETIRVIEIPPPVSVERLRQLDRQGRSVAGNREVGGEG